MLEEQGKRILTILMLMFSLLASSQEIQVNGGFIEDSLLIGQDVHFYVSASYPAELEMVFPDSLYDFSPFEFSNKRFFATELRNGLAFDSTVYGIQSFEIDKVQYLKLPAIILKGTDSVKFSTPTDSISLTELAPIVTDTTQLKTNLDYLTVERQFNYPLLYYVVGGFVILTLILLLIFGRKIIKWIKLRRLRKQYERFAETFAGYLKQMKVDPDPDLAEKALINWKNYQQRLDKQPFSVLTTKEILAYDFTQELEKPLRSIDRVVYGKRMQEDLYQDFEQIEHFVAERYAKKKEEIRNGK